MIRRLAIAVLLVGACVRGTPEAVPTDAAPVGADAAVPDAAVPDAPVPVDAAVTVVPRVIATTPDQGATGIALRVVIEATFSEDMAAASLDAGTFVVTIDGTPVAGSVGYTAATRIATFTPTVALRRSGSYRATLTTEVRNVAGTSLADDVTWTFTTAEGRWSAPQLVETVDLGDAFAPQVAVDAAGNATAVWTQSDGAIWSIWANRFVPGAGWGAATPIETDVVPVARASIAADPAGNAIAIWPQQDGIGANRFVPGVGWGSPQVIAAAAGATQPYVAVDPAGNAIAVWWQLSAGGASYSLGTSRFELGAGWGPAELHVTSPFPIGNPHVAIASSGVAMVVWSEGFPSGQRMIRSLRYAPGAGWELGVPSQAGTAWDQAGFPHVAADTQGDFIVVWQQASTVLANRYVAGSGWAKFITGVSNRGYFPHVAIDHGGKTFAAWHDEGTVGVAHFTPGSGWTVSPPIAVGTVNSTQLAVSPAGEVEVVWAQAIAGRWSIWSNQPSGVNTLLEGDDAGDATEPQVAVDPDGNATAVWQQSDGARISIWASTFR